LDLEGVAKARNSPRGKTQYQRISKSEALHGSGVVDHLAFRATDLKDTMENLSAKGIDFHSRHVRGQGMFLLLWSNRMA
jgi:4-hydroxyphenylpyruvate dioxygenase-like putative hemolysin